MNTKVYLGDSVYCTYDSYGLELTTENGYGPSNRIYLEPAVFKRLTDFVEQLKKLPPHEFHDDSQPCFAGCPAWRGTR